MHLKVAYSLRYPAMKVAGTGFLLSAVTEKSSMLFVSLTSETETRIVIMPKQSLSAFWQRTVRP